MGQLSKRSKMVSIRLSDEEFRRLRELCMTTGARSLSDLARDAMHRLIAGDGTGGEGLTERVAELDQRVNHLQEKVTRLALLFGEESDEGRGRGAA
jgi:DNA anti-recombination protein RmuC